MDSSFTENTSIIATRLARNKFNAAAILKNAGIPVPEHRVLRDVENAVKVANQLGYPVVVKPINQDGGNGVAAGLKDEELVRQAFVAAKKFSKEVLIEKHIEGNDYRLQVFRGKLVWVSHRQPGGVTGDGKSTIKQLLETLNQEPLRGEPGSNALLKRIHLDDEANALLAEQNVKLTTKPKAGEFIRLRRIANVASGGRPMVVDLAEVHPDNQKLVELTARTLRLDMAGVDLIIPDIKQSWLTSGAAICEVNAQPQVWPQLTTELLKKITRGQGRIPVIFALGTQQHQQWINSMAESIAQLGCRVGIAEKHQARLGADVVMYNSQNVLQSAQALLMNKQVDALLVCVDDTELAKLGLPCDKFDMLILLDAPDSDNKQKAWLDFARLLSRGCTGISLINEESPQLNAILDLINKESVKPMKLDQIQNLVIESFKKGMKK
jgi:cyanophycin synthetase